jgi:hypothetical protein
MGKNLGQLANELGDDDIITRFVGIAPKTYYVEYINSKGQKWAIIKTKGAPQPKKYFEKNGRLCLTNYTEMDEAVDTIELMRHDYKNEDLKDIFFSLLTRDNLLVKYSTVMRFDMFKEMATNNSIVVVHYGNIQKTIVDKLKRENSFKVDINLNLERTINKNNWWLKGKRKIIAYQDILYSVPLGFK